MAGSEPPEVNAGAWWLAWGDREVAPPRTDGWIRDSLTGVTAVVHPGRVASRPVVTTHQGCLFVGRLNLRRGSTPGDPESLIDRYLAVGPDFVQELTGEFGFAVADGRHLLMATDRMGIEPVAVAACGAITAAASHPQLLAATPGLMTTPDPEHLVIQVHDPRRLRHRTPHREISHLPPGHLAEAPRPGVLSIRSYWEPLTEPRQTTVIEDVAEVRATFLDAVEWRAADASQPAAELSGGLDSSAIVGALASLSSADRRRVPTFSRVLAPGRRDGADDERHHAEAVIDHVAAAEPHWIETDSGAALEATSRDPTAPPADPLYAAAADRGVDVLFSGFGGDEYASFSGRYFFAQLLLRARFFTLARELDAFARRRTISRSQAFRNPLMAQTLDVLEGQYRRIRPTRVTAVDLFLTPALERIVDIRETTRSGSPLSLRDPVGSYQRYLHGLTSSAQRARLENRVASRYGLVVRYPLQDPRLVELAWSLAPDRWTRDGWHRWLWRQAIDGLVPDSVRQRLDKRPPLPGANDPAAATRAVQHLLRQVDSVPADSLARHWVDVDRASAAVAGVEAITIGKVERSLRAYRALWSALSLDYDAKRSGW